MSYRLEDREGVADGIRRIVAEELDDAIAGLRTGEDRDTAIHEARKSLKKARSALRLARTDLRRGHAQDRERRHARREPPPVRAPATRRSCSTRWRG